MTEHKDPSPSLPSVQELKKKIASDNLSQVIEELLTVTESLGDASLHDDMVLLSSQYEQYQREQRLGTTDYDRLFITRTRIGRGLLDIISVLPQNTAGTITTGDKATPKFRGILESRLKKQVFIMTLASKIILVFYVLQFAPWAAGGFSKGQTIATILLLVPIFAAYLTVMIKEFVEHRNILGETAGLKKRVNRTFQLITYFVFPVYVFLMISVIGMKPKGNFSFEEMNSWLAVVESGFGVYVGELVFGLFRKKE